MQSKGVRVIKAVLFDLFGTIVLITEREENYYPRCLRKLYDVLVENGVNVSFEEFSRVYFEVRKSFMPRQARTLKSRILMFEFP